MKDRIVIIGGGESGVGAAYLANKKGYEVFLSDYKKIEEKYRNILLKMKLILKREVIHLKSSTKQMK
jgi:UDP-N-acetylmuramoylalanine--D-glutamate ligase